MDGTINNVQHCLGEKCAAAVNRVVFSRAVRVVYVFNAEFFFFAIHRGQKAPTDRHDLRRYRRNISQNIKSWRI